MSQKKCKAWTIDEWQAGYRSQQLDIDDLIEYVAAWRSDDDFAWISLASTALLTEQIQTLKDKASQVKQQALPLYGIPFAVKDNIDVAGFASTVACPSLSDIKTEDAEVIRRLKQAGAIVVGKTNLDQFATGLVGTRSPFGAVPNSFNPEYISGGSSSGSASVVARGLVPFSLGTDTAGSGRVPAALNNIVGLKPSKGRLSNRGVFPACKSLDCVSVFALTVEDAELVAQIASAYDEKDSYSRRNPCTTPARFSASVHFAIPQQLNFYGDTQAEYAFQQVLARLQSMGITISPIDFTAFEKLALQLYQGAWVAERTAAVDDLLTQHANVFDPTVAAIIGQGRNYTAVDAYQAEYIRQDLSREINQILQQFDALLLPTAPTTYRIAEVMANPLELNARLGIYTNFTNLADLTALALPAGFAKDGLPFGISLIAPAWHDQALSHFGKLWQAQSQLTLGAMDKVFQPSSTPTTLTNTDTHIRVAVVGAHLTGMPLNFQLTTRQAVHVETTTTSNHYALYALDTTPPKPGLLRTTQANQSIIVELWDIPTARFGEFVAEIAAPLAMGNLELIDGRWVKGFVCEAYALSDALNISQFGGWRSYIQSLSNSKTAPY